MLNINSLSTVIRLGNLNEKGISEIQFDVTEWLTDYPTGELSVTYMRPGENSAYPALGTIGLPAVVSLANLEDGDLSLEDIDDIIILTWIVSNTVTEFSGFGSVVVKLSIEDTSIMCSKKARTYVYEGHPIPTGIPPIMKPWYDALNARVIILEELVDGLIEWSGDIEERISALELLHNEE